MKKENIFISYCTEDLELLKLTKDYINSFKRLNAIVVPQLKSNLSYNSEKVKNELDNSKYFLPILTSNSINNQWVNQEVGYAIHKFKNHEIKPLVEKTIVNDLKGFITASNDLNYRFEKDKFAIKMKEIVDDINGDLRPIRPGIIW